MSKTRGAREDAVALPTWPGCPGRTDRKPRNVRRRFESPGLSNSNGTGASAAQCAPATRPGPSRRKPYLTIAKRRGTIPGRRMVPGHRIMEDIPRAALGRVFPVPGQAPATPRSVSRKQPRGGRGLAGERSATGERADAWSDAPWELRVPQGKHVTSNFARPVSSDGRRSAQQSGRLARSG